MTYNIYQNKKIIGTIEINGSELIIKNSTDELKTFIENSIRDGITRKIDIHHNKKSIIVNEEVKRDDPLFELALIEWLKDHGYEVIELHPEVDQELLILADKITNIPENKKSLIDTLPYLNYLEKTFLLEYFKSLYNDLNLKSKNENRQT